MRVTTETPLLPSFASVRPTGAKFYVKPGMVLLLPPILPGIKVRP